MWIEEAYSGLTKNFCCDPTKVRMLYDLTGEVRVGFGQTPYWRNGPLESTELRLHCEISETKMYHVDRWTAWGESVNSKFERAEAYDAE
jgi:hypothetical protein